MKTLMIMSTVRRFGAAIVLGTAAVTASAVPIADMRLQDLLPMAPDFKTELKLNANQQILWQQMESKTRQLLRERQSRRERLQASVQQALASPNLELRDLVGGMDQESTVSLAEEKQLREWWLSVNDALDEKQRQAVAVFIAGQMARVMDGGAPRGESRGREGGEPGGRKGGGKGGMGGMGMGAGSGGASLNFPGS